MNNVIHAEECYKIVGACFEVYREKGCGFLEPVFQECLEYELRMQGIPFEPQRVMPLSYKGRPLLQTYRADFLCFGTVIVEIKAVSKLVDEHRAQLLNYLAASNLRLGLLVNFGHHPKLEWERIVR
ncbi:MAG: GxxExxY protein [Opitutus sp.]|nr:GxxExxY protein [Opitutus sp.]